MSVRELVVLGTSSAVPTPRRNHNGYFLRFDGHGVLVDPGEGTQLQMRRAGVSAHDITRILITHFHGDHCLGLPGVIQRIARDGVTHPVYCAYPAQGAHYFDRLRHASAFGDTDAIRPQPLCGEAAACGGDADLQVSARALDHSIACYGYRLAEPDGWTMLPDLLARRGITGPDAGRLKTRGHVTAPDGRRVELAECARPRRGQVVAFVFDTAPCAAAEELARGADLLVIEATYTASEAALAAAYGHLTAPQAGAIAAAAGAKALVLTHFSERYEPAEAPRFAAEAAAAGFTGPITVAADLDRVTLPPRRR
ncbi:ribonuclease Z [Streptomonospora litoralis]|uniref:Ribonuclease Z n=1 Tax=Streptomonospora litoralis TaxID=2498135 RepID=A0A4P6Q126_9ACTN|nr:ribonuclease Z [Streptomonospora litoralis]QBI54326.1 Ribonuclease BN [Streptomonospora litoralis]